MADYCTADDVISDVKGLEVTANTAVTTTKLAEIITQESSIIDAHIQERYTLPITDSTALTFLKRICISLCVYRVTKILQEKDSRPVPDGRVIQDISNSSSYRDAMNMLKMIANGKMSIPNQEITNEKNVSFSSSYDPDECFEFKHNEQQW